MGIEELETRILRDARVEANGIMDRAAALRDEILKEADAEAEAVYQRQFAALKLKVEEEKKQKVTLEALEARKAVLREKRALLDSVFSAARDELLTLPEDRYPDLMVKMVVAASTDGTGEVLLSGADREKIGGELVARANRALENAGKAAGLSLSEDTRDIKGGFVLRSGNVEIDGSFAAEIESRRAELEEKLVEMLFGDAGASGGSFEGA